MSVKKILVIEDNTDVRENLCEILELADYDVESAKNGKLGVEKAKKWQPDLILCDVMMPELDGFGVLKILNRQQETFDIPFIFLTARVEKTDIRKGMGLGADDYITKPFDDTELLEAVEMRLKKSERLQKVIEENVNGNPQQLLSMTRAWETLKEKAVTAELRNYRKKDQIFEQGQYPSHVYYVEQGKVKLSKTSELGKELIIHIYGPGEFFGYKAMVRDQAYRADAHVLEDAKIRLLPKKDFQELMLQDREFTAYLIQTIAREAADTEQQLLDLAYSSVRKKTANALLYFLPKDKNTGKPFVITATRDDLASVAGTAKETLIRTLSDFKSEGLIEIEGGNIKVLDEDELREMPQ